MKDLISHGNPVYRFFKVVYQMFFKVVYSMFFKVVYPMFFKVVYPMFFKVVYPMFFKVVYSMFFHASYVVQEVFLLMFLFLITKTPFSRSSLPVPATLGQIQNATAEEGRNETKECNLTVGTPLNVSWKNVKTGQFTKGKLLTIINVRRNQSGEYRCIANNTCGNESTGMFIDMHCKNLFKVFTRLSDVYYSMLVSVFYNCVLNHIAVISMLLSSQS